MLLQTGSSEEINIPMKMLHLNNGKVQIQILHIGSIPHFMSNYLTVNNICSHIANPPAQNSDVDMVIVNGEQNLHRKNIRGISSQIRPVVTYRKGLKLPSKKDEIPFVLIPILISYVLKLKESYVQLNRLKSLNTTDRFLQKLISTIDENLDDHTLTMNKLSELVYMSRSSFSKKIKQYTGMKPTEFINSYKLEKSKHLLMVTNWQIGKIADHLGFCSQHYYCKLFKKNEGVNPTQFRKKHRDTQNFQMPKLHKTSR